MQNLESDLTFIGMVGMIDPPREEVKEAVKKCTEAGIRPVMITGDHKITAMAIAKELGILREGDEAVTGTELEAMSDEELKNRVKKISVYARVSPEHKVRIVRAWQANGEIVAMTGDGVNDAPALKKADIGCAMGVVGTDVAKEAADVILTDDNFATVVSAVEEGRRIYDNIIKAIAFLLSSNIGEIVVLFVAILITPWLATKFGIPQEYINYLEPLLPIQILWVNLVTDSLPALALAVDPAEKDVMKRSPKKNSKGVFTKGLTFRMIYQGIMIGVITLIAFIVGLSIDSDDPMLKIDTAQTMAFTVLALSELVHVFNIRNNKESIFKSNPFNNRKLILAILVSAALMFVVLLVPALRDIFSIVVLPMDKLLETAILVISPIIIVEIMKLLKLNTTKDEE
jgi:Ca2+-transporting ATPase